MKQKIVVMLLALSILQCLVSCKDHESTLDTASMDTFGTWVNEKVKTEWGVAKTELTLNANGSFTLRQIFENKDGSRNSQGTFKIVGDSVVLMYDTGGEPYTLKKQGNILIDESENDNPIQLRKR